jgi:hypothetical protein
LKVNGNFKKTDNMNNKRKTIMTLLMMLSVAVPFGQTVKPIDPDEILLIVVGRRAGKYD